MANIVHCYENRAKKNAKKYFEKGFFKLMNTFRETQSLWENKGKNKQTNKQTKRTMKISTLQQLKIWVNIKCQNQTIRKRFFFFVKFISHRYEK